MYFDLSMASDRLKVLSGHLSEISRAMSRSPITTHVLDTSRGCPAAGVPITISVFSDTEWKTLGAGVTDQDGRCSQLLAATDIKQGTYKVHFDTNTYFSSCGNKCPFYPYADVVFIVRDCSQHYHIPLLLSNFSYSTYRGS